MTPIVKKFVGHCCWLLCNAMLSTPIVALASGPLISDFELTEVADGVFVHPGRHVDVAHPLRGDSANLGFIVGSNCVAVIDTGGALNTGQALYRAITERSSIPICYVINTHVHFDHILGNAAFSHLAVEFVGHQNLSEVLANSRDFFRDNFAEELLDSAALIAGPTINVTQSLRLDIGDRVLVLNAHPTSHSNTDLTVFDEQTRTLFSGDLVFIDRLPVLDGSLKGWLAWIAGARQLEISRVVPGHGPISAPWPEAATALTNYLNILLSDARNAVNSGETLEAATATMSRSAARKWLVNDRHGRNVSKAYREVEWE